jgi:hypothetical protein
MSNDVKSGIGYLIPVGGLVGFVLSLIAGNYLLGIFFAVAGVLLWFLYMVVMETSLPTTTGNVIILFGVLLSLAIFLNYGWEQTIWGGYTFRADGSIFSLVILFFSVLSGILFRQHRQGVAPAKVELTPEEQALVKKALTKEGEEAPDTKVIVIKPESSETQAEAEEEDEEEDYEYEAYPYGYGYPPYYYEEEEEDEEYEEEEEE